MQGGADAYLQQSTYGSLQQPNSSLAVRKQTPQRLSSQSSCTPWSSL